ncbi:MAG: lactate utilization protein [Clostridia bacterium]|nr:lactate utilization protein [Clostridia bacterium]MBQ6000638.1 lactate utilization protein [Clostridia bacterium]
MDQNLARAQTLRMQQLAKALEKNNMDVICLENKEQVVPTLEGLIEKGAKVSVGGSATLFETGVIDWLRSYDCEFHDRYAPGLTGEQVMEVFRAAFTDDVYLTSTNAVTEAGELVNVDANGNRVAAMLFGPKKVIVVTGMNKLVRDVPAAFARIEEVAAPANAIRLGRKTPCTETGRCMHCKSEDAICRKATILASQQGKGRVTVILVAEKLGY